MQRTILPPRAPTAALAVCTCSVLLIAGALVVAGRPRPDPCALPPGVSALVPAAQSEVARHVLACRDLEHGRITRDDYRGLIGAKAAPAPAPAPLPAIEWASSVRAVSSEYSPNGWSAQQVLGPPDVYPAAGDLPKAWASRQPDAGPEFIEVGFARPVAMRELRIFETFNPGAIESIDAITVSGRHVTRFACGAGFTDGACDAPMAAPGSGSRVTAVPLACGEPIAAVRVTLATAAVPGWNELDAIGGVPCSAN